MDEVKLQMSQVAKEIGESVNVLRNWVKDFGEYIPLVRSKGNYNLFTQDAINTVKRIQHMYRDQNLTTKQIIGILSGAVLPEVPETVPSYVEEELKEIKEMLVKQQEFNQMLVETLEKQNQHIEQMVKRRDEQVLLSLREIRESKKPKPWYKRLLKPVQE